MADLQRAPGALLPLAPARLPLKVAATRTFDTPEFAGMTFLEVEAKTALNRVKGMPFPWSINPYRGCSHACSYCLGGDTPVLMADGRSKPIAEVRPGDRVYGTERRGAYRRFVITEVLDHWSTTKLAYRVRLEDETALVASGDHRFLTNRGWKHVTGAGRGPGCRPHLTSNDRLIGTGASAQPPAHTADYKRGYLCGMTRSDELQAIRRLRSYLADADVLATHVIWQEAVGGPRSSGPHFNDEWQQDPSPEWCKGFLAGNFDAEGGCSRSILRITNSNPVIIERLTLCLSRFGFAFVLEPLANGCTNVRVTGGLREHLRFFHTVDPAITHKRSIEGQALKFATPLRVVAIEPLGLELPLYDITTGTGDFIANGVVSHNCFARPTHAYLNLSPLEDFERTVVVKTNLVEVLRRELARPSWKGEHVALGTNTDPYQRCEGRYRLMPGVIAALASSYTPFSILTKGTLVLRDRDALVAASERVPVTAALTVGMLDEALWREAESGTPSPRARLDAVAALNGAGVPTGVMLAPIMPGLSDGEEQLAALVDAAAAASATHVTPIVLHLRPGVRELFWPWLQRAHPELIDLYAGLYKRATAEQGYRTRIEAFVADRRREAWRRHGRPTPPPAEPRTPAAQGEQLRLL